MVNQKNQTIYIDIFIPKDAKAGYYKGNFKVEVGNESTIFPVKIDVYDFLMPEKLSFLGELNAYHIPADYLDFHRVAHQNRLVFNPWRIAPRVTGEGKNIKLDWLSYDKSAGPLLSGEAFKNNRRAGVPTPVMYLPFWDSWPMVLTKENYNYKGYWPGRGEDKKYLVDHYLTSPYIGEALSQSYKDSFLAAQKQFIEHFKARGWNKTEMQLFFGSKKTHRIDYGSNMWWTTDEPFHWDDWQALQFYNALWVKGRDALKADPKLWVTRADISRPQWNGRVMDKILSMAYWGGFTNDRIYKRSEWLARETGVKTRSYGSVNPDIVSNSRSLTRFLNIWLHGGDGHLPWQTVGNKNSLDNNDNVGGAALLVQAKEYGFNVVGDMRLKAMRDAEQIIEYMIIFARHYKLQRKQINDLLLQVANIGADRSKGAVADNASGSRYTKLQAWEVDSIRRQLAEKIMEKH